MERFLWKSIQTVGRYDAWEEDGGYVELADVRFYIRSLKRELVEMFLNTFWNVKQKYIIQTNKRCFGIDYFSITFEQLKDST